MASPETRPHPAPALPQIQREVLPSASRHVALALVHVPGPFHEIEPQPYHRISFNIGPSYGVDSSRGAHTQRMAFARHSLMIIPAGVGAMHQASNPPRAGMRTRPGRLATFRISRELFSESAMSLGLRQGQAQLAHKVVPADEVLRLLAQTLFADLRAGNPDGPLASEAAARALVCRLLLRDQRERGGGPASAVARVQQHIDAHLASALTLEQLADVAGMSLFHFCRVFRDSLGVTPHQYILGRRMEQARRLLWAGTGMSMLEVALACGFGSSSHFSAQFKRHTGQTPRQWQRSH